MINHQNNFGTNVTTNTLPGVTTTPLNSIPTVDAPFYLALDATNANSHYEIIKCTSKTATNVLHSATTYAHTTDEEVRMVVPAEEMNGISSAIENGWSPVSDTWAYASATTITVPSGAGSLYQKGDKIKLTNGSLKYFYIVSVADTVLTVTGGTDYTLAVGAISGVYVSKVENPQGFPHWFNFTIVTAGEGGSAGSYAQTVYNAKFKVNGSSCSIKSLHKITNLGSWSGTFYYQLPVSALSSVADNFEFFGTITQNSINPLTQSRAIAYRTNGTKLYFTGAISSSYLTIAGMANNDWVLIGGTYEI